ncbi:septal ring lytic transglycosylase RlpA family protein [Piscinibacter sp. XHJ-5]|uniref:septal ring lytic transglycosylase RlpA family protein n=1 Tax=Piscinibacter sp. XHJ-5 TaxID=3037797 RepID=UPI0024532731|nr:septal ring lytic transglycosylase RlpA family protein [Piscinibacter sp. XHJ-5]
MRTNRCTKRWTAWALMSLLAFATGIRAEPPAQPARDPAGATAQKPQIDHSGRPRVGKASFYARYFFGRRMADGTPMDPHGDNAASRTLPLGTKARVTNLETGRSAIVTIQDRGPYVKGRIVDLSPATAQRIGLTQRDGLAPVEVAPIAVPQPDGSVKSVAGADEDDRPEGTSRRGG